MQPKGDSVSTPTIMVTPAKMDAANHSISNESLNNLTQYRGADVSPSMSPLNSPIIGISPSPALSVGSSYYSENICTDFDYFQSSLLNQSLQLTSDIDPSSTDNFVFSAEQMNPLLSSLSLSSSSSSSNPSGMPFQTAISLPDDSLIPNRFISNSSANQSPNSPFATSHLATTGPYTPPAVIPNAPVSPVISPHSPHASPVFMTAQPQDVMALFLQQQQQQQQQQHQQHQQYQQHQLHQQDSVKSIPLSPLLSHHHVDAQIQHLLQSQQQQRQGSLQNQNYSFGGGDEHDSTFNRIVSEIDRMNSPLPLPPAVSTAQSQSHSQPQTQSQAVSRSGSVSAGTTGSGLQQKSPLLGVAPKTPLDLLSGGGGVSGERKREGDTIDADELLNAFTY
jgi:hypothetical protein